MKTGLIWLNYLLIMLLTTVGILLLLGGLYLVFNVNWPLAILSWIGGILCCCSAFIVTYNTINNYGRY